MIYSVFLSIVIVVRNNEENLKEILTEMTTHLSQMVSDYELIVIDNSSTDGSADLLENLVKETGLPNLQVYMLTKEADVDTASWVGFENALGDFVVLVDPFGDEVSFIRSMLDSAVSGADVVFGNNTRKHEKNSILYRTAYFCFHKLYKLASGVDLAKEAPQFRIISKKVVNFILRHPQPALIYRQLPATGGFKKVYLSYSYSSPYDKQPLLSDSVARASKLLFSTTSAPMRIVTGLSLFGAIANLIYSFYVVTIALFKNDVAPGWVSQSLQSSGMFFLLSLVLFVLGEYILNMVRLSNEGPRYHIGRELTSSLLSREKKLNIEEANSSSKESGDYGY